MLLGESKGPFLLMAYSAQVGMEPKTFPLASALQQWNTAVQDGGIYGAGGEYGTWHFRTMGGLDLRGLLQPKELFDSIANAESACSSTGLQQFSSFLPLTVGMT